MKNTIRGAQVSVGVHALIFLLFFCAGSFSPRQRQILLDFSIANATGVAASAPKSLPGPQVVEQKQPQTVTPTAESEDAAPLHADKKTDQPAPSEQARPSAGSAEEVKARYFRSHFAFIRDRILRNLSYPLIARKMGVSGRVTVSFVILEDGNVEQVMIVDSSGSTVLDRNAMDTIRRTAPFPKPPITAELVMPIVYRLEN